MGHRTGERVRRWGENVRNSSGCRQTTAGGWGPQATGRATADAEAAKNRTGSGTDRNGSYFRDASGGSHDCVQKWWGHIAVMLIEIYRFKKKTWWWLKGPALLCIIYWRDDSLNLQNLRSTCQNARFFSDVMFYSKQSMCHSSFNAMRWQYYWDRLYK